MSCLHGHPSSPYGPSMIQCTSWAICRTKGESTSSTISQPFQCTGQTRGARTPACSVHTRVHATCFTAS
jgi:hypothetical protein